MTTDQELVEKVVDILNEEGGSGYEDFNPRKAAARVISIITSQEREACAALCERNGAFGSAADIRSRKDQP